MQEDLHFVEMYNRNHTGLQEKERQKHVAMARAEAKKKRLKQTINTSAAMSQKLSGIEKVMRQVNQDKCNYSKLLSYEMQDIEFI